MPEGVRGRGLDGVRLLSHEIGRMTSAHRMLPGVLIVGAQRSGTTSMFKTLRQHPNVLPPFLQKGLHYFDVGYDRGLDWYQGFFPLRTHARRVARRTGSPAVTLESSPYYMFHPLAAGRIAKDLPGVKLLCLLRDPVERAFSAHAHESSRGYETETFDRAVELEPQRTRGAVEQLLADPLSDHFHLQHHAYLARGRYVEQLERLASLVGRERLHVVDSQDFFQAPEASFTAVVDFLSLPPAADIVFEQHNATPRPAPLAPDLRQRLDTYFLPYDEQLSQWLGWTPSWRR